MRILGIERDELAVNHYRILQPLYKLREHGLADVMFLEDGPELVSDYGYQKLMEADIVVAHRASDKNWFDFMKRVQEVGKCFVLDYDDDPFNTSPWNPYYRYIGTGEYKYKWPDGTEEYVWKDGINDFDIERNIIRRDMFRACFKRADMVSTTTDILKDTLSKMNKNTFTLPNLMDFSLWDHGVEFKKNEIRIGWQGGVSHYEDLYMIKDALVKVLKKHKNVKFLFMGDYRFEGLFKDVPEGQYEHISWVKHVAFPYKFPLLNLDINLCPIIDNQFNRNKSSIKWLNGSAVKSATIASNIPPYSVDIKDGETGLLVNENEWFEAMDELITNEKKRKKLAKNAYEDVYENHNADKKCHLWHDAYKKVLIGDRECPTLSATSKTS